MVQLITIKSNNGGLMHHDPQKHGDHGSALCRGAIVDNPRRKSKNGAYSEEYDIAGGGR
jgi:hypothetical protein